MSVRRKVLDQNAQITHATKKQESCRIIKIPILDPLELLIFNYSIIHTSRIRDSTCNVPESLKPYSEHAMNWSFCRRYSIPREGENSKATNEYRTETTRIFLVADSRSFAAPPDLCFWRAFQKQVRNKSSRAVGLQRYARAAQQLELTPNEIAKRAGERQSSAF